MFFILHNTQTGILQVVRWTCHFPFTFHSILHHLVHRVFPLVNSLHCFFCCYLIASR